MQSTEEVVLSLFWDFVVHRGVLTNDEIEIARKRQRTFRVPLGRLAIAERVLSLSQVVKIMTEQADTDELFGQIAVRLGFLGPNELESLLQKQGHLIPDLGAILVDMGALDESTLRRERDAYLDFLSPADLEAKADA